MKDCEVLTSTWSGVSNNTWSSSQHYMWPSFWVKLLEKISQHYEYADQRPCHIQQTNADWAVIGPLLVNCVTNSRTISGMTWNTR